MKFKSEDEAYDAYLEYVQSECPFDITAPHDCESQEVWDTDLSDGFYDWMDDNNVEIEGD